MEFLSKESILHFDEIKKGLKFYNIHFEENHKLVRGLDYYCGTVFEFKCDNLGAQDTLLGGGRYDGLISSLGGPEIPGIGWAAGIERISMLMELPNNNNAQVHLAITDEKFKPHLQKIIKYMKENQISFYWNYKFNLKKSLSKANSNNISNVIIIGENEFNNDFFTLKHLKSGEQFELKIDKVKNYIDDKS